MARPENVAPPEAVNLTFLSAKLPSWAGTRQNIQGRDITGDPLTITNVTLNSSSLPPTANPTTTAATSLFGSLGERIRRLEREVTNFQQKVEEVEQRLIAVGVRLDGVPVEEVLPQHPGELEGPVMV